MPARCRVCKAAIVEDGIKRYGTRAGGKRERVCVDCYRLLAVDVHSVPFIGAVVEEDPYLAKDEFTLTKEEEARLGLVEEEETE